MPGWSLIEQAFFSSLSAIGETTSHLLFGIGCLLFTAWLVWHRDGWSKLTEHLGKKFIQTVLGAVVCFVPVFLWHLGYEQRAGEVLASPPVQALAMTPKYREPKDSLRIKAIHLADDLDAFTNDRWSSRPAADAESIKKYDEQTLNLYATHYKDKTLRILQELRAKGLDVGLLDSHDLAQTRALQMNETKELRCVAHYLDEKGNINQIPK